VCVCTTTKCAIHTYTHTCVCVIIARDIEKKKQQHSTTEQTCVVENARKTKTKYYLYVKTIKQQLPHLMEIYNSILWSTRAVNNIRFNIYVTRPSEKNCAP